MRANTSRRRRAGARDTHGGRSTPGSKEEKVFETRQKCLQKLAVLIVFLGTQTARKKSYKCQSRRPRHRNVRLRAQTRPVYRCLSILRVTRHHVLVGQPLACRSGAVVSLHRSTIAFREPRPTARTRSTGPRHRNVRLRAQAWPVYRCLSIVRATQHHPLVGQPLVCRSGAVVSLHHSTIIITFFASTVHTPHVSAGLPIEMCACALKRGRCTDI